MSENTQINVSTTTEIVNVDVTETLQPVSLECFFAHGSAQDTIINVSENVVNIDLNVTETQAQNVEIDFTYPVGPQGPQGPAGSSLWGTISGTLSAQTDLWRYLSAVGTSNFDILTLTNYLSTNSILLCSLNVNGQILSAGVNLFDIFLTSDTDAQTLSYIPSNYLLSISNGNTINLSSINSTFNSVSGKYESVYTNVQSNSSNWQSTYLTVSSLSANWNQGGTSLANVVNYLSTNNVSLCSLNVNGQILSAGTNLSDIFLPSSFALPSSIFWKFTNQGNYRAHTSFSQLNAFLSDDSTTRRLYVAGRASSYGYGLGSNIGNFAGTYYQPVTLIDPDNLWEDGETIQEFYFGGLSLYYLTNLGNLFSVGFNLYGQLGIGNTTNQTSFKKITTFNKNISKFAVSQSSNGYDFCYAITKTGQLYGWGYNNLYNLGIPSNNTVAISTPTLLNSGSISGKTIIDIYPTGDITSIYGNGFVIDSDRNVHVAGFNSGGILGSAVLINTSTTSGWIQISGIKADEVWASNYSGTGTAFLFNKNLGIIYSSGSNSNGQLGDGTQISRSQFLSVSLFTGLSVVGFTAGNQSVSNPAAILSDGTVRTWGYNGTGQIGNGTIISPVLSLYNLNNTPSNLNLNNTTNKVVKIRYAGYINSSGSLLTNSGKIYSTGYNLYGQLAVGDNTNRTRWTLAPHPTNRKFVDFEYCGTGEQLVNVAVDEDGELWVAGYGGDGTTATGDYFANPSRYVWTKPQVQSNPAVWTTNINNNTNISISGVSFWGSISGTLSDQTDLWGYLSTVQSNSANWTTAYTNLVTNSAAYLTSVDLTFLRSPSANWQSTYTTVCSNSGNWNTGYNIGTAYQNASGSFAPYSYVNNNFLALSGGTVTGPVRINNNLTVFGNISASGTATFSNTIFATTSALSVVHVGSGPAMWVGNNGDGDIASFYDIDQNIEILHVGGQNGTFPNVGVKTSQPNKDFTVKGEISASNTIYDNVGNSSQWNQAFNIATTYQNASSSFATNTTLNSVSGLLTPLTTTNILTGQLVTNIAFASYQTNVAAATATLLQTSIYQNASGNWQNTFTTVQSNSSNWQATYLTAITSVNNFTGKDITINNYILTTTSQSVSSNRKYAFDTTLTTLTATLPSSPNTGDEIEFFDIYGTWSTRPLVIANNTRRIEYQLDELLCNVQFGLIKLVYTNNTIGWRIIPLPKHNVPSVETITILAPIPVISASALSGTTPFTVTLTGFNTLPVSSSPVTNWFWNLTGGNTTQFTTSAVTYTYNTAGTYTVNLTASNNSGAGTTSRLLTAVTVTTPTTSLSTDPFSEYVTLLLTFEP